METRKTYKRVISLIPSITEFLIKMQYPLKNIVGRTNFCIYPQEAIKNIPVIGSTKQVDLEKIKSANPDMVIVSTEENPLSMVKMINKTIGNNKVFVTDVTSIQKALKYLNEISLLLNLNRFSKFEKEFNNKLPTVENFYTGSVLYFVWKKPYMTAGNKTYIDDWLNTLGFTNKGRNFTGKIS
ncbi:MAG: ABC transporter substrate-binding protein [Calditrichia bacterium]|nr:ABC transporter substrate-binding protein [Calditrichia bacterium]